MLYRSLNVATILLLSWFAFTSMQLTQQLSLQLSQVKQELFEKSDLTAATQLETNNQIGEIQAYITNQKTLSTQKKQVDAKLSSQKKLTRFHRTYSIALNAELLRLNKQYKEAATLIKSTKKDIWTAGDTYPDKQKALRGLMPKIDALVKAWNKSDASASAKPVYLVLDKIIQEKGK